MKVKRGFTGKKGQVLSSVVFGSKFPIDKINELIAKHECSRADVLEVFLRHFYTPQEFGKRLSEWLTEKQKIRQETLQANREKLKEGRRLVKLLQDNPEMMEKLKKELEE